MKTTNVFRKTIFDKKTYNKELFQYYVQKCYWEYFYGQSCAEALFSIFSNYIENSLNKSILKKTVFIRNDKSNLTLHQKWVTEKTQQHYKQIHQSMNPSDAKYKLFQSNFIESLNSDRNDYLTNVFADLSNDREKWNFINEARKSLKTKTIISSLKNVFGETVLDQTKIANLLNYRFSKLGDYLGGIRTFSEELIDGAIRNKTTFKFNPITLFECKQIVRQLKSNKPLGPSNIPAWALKDCLNIIAEPLTYLINAFIEEGRFPNHLKRAHVVPIYKNGDTEEPNNYRPISITSAISKIFEKVIRNQMVEYLNKHNYLSPIQFGFRAKFSTTDALLYATENIRSDINNNKMVAAAFLDLSKAFDSISHEILLKKLEGYHFDSTAIALIKCYLTNRTQKVILQNISSDWISLYQGVPQGTVLGPLLFNLYVNSMQKIIDETCKIVQYADDIFLFVADKCVNTAKQRLENNIAKLVEYFESHRLNLNEDKTEFIVFCKNSQNKLTKNLKLQVKNYSTSLSSFVKYLGVYLDQNLTYENEVKHVLKKMACGIKTIYAVKQFLPEKVCLLLLNALVLSHLHYPAILLQGFSQNLLTTLEKQLSWGVKACFNRQKQDSSSVLKIKHNILPIRIFLDYKSCFYFWKYHNNLLPAFSGPNTIPTARMKYHSRTKKLVCNTKIYNEFMRKSFFIRTLPLWNSLPSCLVKKKFSAETIKSKYKVHFSNKIAKEIEQPEHRKNCWRDYRFS